MSNPRWTRGRGGSTNTNTPSWRNAAKTTDDPKQPQRLGSFDNERGTGRAANVARGRGRGGNLKTPALSRMDLMASVSRSSGLQRDGNDLKNFAIQSEYREFIQGKFEDYTRRFPLEDRTQNKRRADPQENVLILFRKLREGVYASKRHDGFALEVYETSFFLGIIFDSPKQIAVVMAHLVPGVYQSSSCPKPLCHQTTVISLLYHLVASYPSQSTYHRHLTSIPGSVLPRQSKASTWIRAVASTMRTTNYARLFQLTKKASLPFLFEDKPETLGLETPTISEKQANATKLCKLALLVVLDNLRSKARDKSWDIMRSAYRELSCDPNAEDTKKWLNRSLCLRPLLNTDDRSWTAESWLEHQANHGHTRRKERIEGRWIVCKVV
ncbi:hypothetical protein FA15DRAFT_754043 [Coprinopsis marcescibilis]|uniref:Uncharacterized protein n=1 Tax=Coprinopsis marcescibilis TaxID=230819 RepID=A0A5C3L3Q7_COPMA|nr:hypothetical protein FA15DRAFT_754043 [Coprinopsis marcescibilis]